MHEDADGNVLDVGRKRRTAPPALRRAVLQRDQGCRFPGCTNQIVDIHHIEPWSEGDKTTLENCIALCRRHHTLLHEGGYHMVRGEGRIKPAWVPESEPVLTFVTPGGEVLRRILPRKNGGEEPDGGYYHHAVIETIPEVDATTHINRWLGEHLDLDLALGGVLRDDAAPRCGVHEVP